MLLTRLEIEILDETPLKLKSVASGSLARDFDVTYNY